MKLYEILRWTDAEDGSDARVVAQGCQFDNGVVVIAWLGEVPSTACYPSIEDFVKVHGHGLTVIRQIADLDGKRVCHRWMNWLQDQMEYPSAVAEPGNIGYFAQEREKLIKMLDPIEISSPDPSKVFFYGHRKGDAL